MSRSVRRGRPSWATGSAIDLPDRAVHQLLESLLATGDGLWLEPVRNALLEVLQRHGSVRDGAPELAVPSRIALVQGVLDRSPLEQLGSDEKRARERVDAADVRVE